jgi:hypothetical protein
MLCGRSLPVPRQRAFDGQSRYRFTHLRQAFMLFAALFLCSIDTGEAAP